MIAANKNKIYIAAFFMVFLALITPIVFYLSTFGLSISEDHSRWSQAGDFIGGIYAPIVALLTLAIIFGQFFSQVHFNKFQIDQSFINNANSELHYYIEQLDTIMRRHEHISNVPLGHVLVEMYSTKTKEELKGAIPQKDVRRILMSDTRISGIWGAINTIFSGLKAFDEYQYSLAFSSSKQKCVAIFGYGLCVALDNHHYVSCNFPSDFCYEFSQATK